MKSKFLKFLSLGCAAFLLSAVVLQADEEKKECKECPCEKEKPKAVVAEEEKEDKKKDGKCPCEKEKKDA